MRSAIPGAIVVLAQHALDGFVQDTFELVAPTLRLWDGVQVPFITVGFGDPDAELTPKRPVVVSHRWPR